MPAHSAIVSQSSTSSFNSNTNKLSEKIILANVHTCFERLGEWIHIVEIKTKTTTRVLFRKYREFWKLHEMIVGQNSAWLIDGEQRLLPFMDPPSRKTIGNELAINRTERLNFYLSKVCELGCLVESHDFFQLRGSDYNDNTLLNNSMSLLQELLEFEINEKPIMIKVCYGDNNYVWKHYGILSMQDLTDSIMTFNANFKKIYYRNEFHEKSLMTSDEELRMLSFKRFKLVFTVK